MQVRAKFRVDSIKRTLGNKVEVDAHGSPIKDASGRDKYVPCEMVTLELFPVYGNGDPHHENTKFWASSPSGKFELNCVNENATAMFKIGKEYYIDITPA
jgi:hypothetical protein